MEHPVRTLGAGAVVVGLGVALLLVTLQETGSEPASLANHEAFGYLTAALALALFTVFIEVIGHGLGGLVVGKDNRVSTSLVQVAIWTYAIAFALITLIAMTWVGSDKGFNAITSSEFDFGDYLVLLGGPFLAAASARYLVGAKVANGDLAKPPAADPSIGQAVTDDAGNADLIDSQYLLFNIIALIYFLGAFFQEPTEGFPDIPTLLFALTSAAAASYVANKAVVNAAPAITGVSPQTAKRGEPVTVFGTNLLVPTSDTNAPFLEISATVDGVVAPLDAATRQHQPTGDDRFQLTIPDLEPDPPAEGKLVDVRILNFRGVGTNTKQITVKP
jgi:hypothetical protein